MSKVLEALKQKSILISDGAWGTFLYEKGLSVDECPESWNLSRPEDVYDIALSYVKSGADTILTNSFGGSSIKLDAYGLGNQCYEINKAAAEISRKAAGKDVLVLGSIGPTGKMILMGEITETELYDAFKYQSKALADGGADAIIVETMSDLDEAIVAVKAAKESTGLEVICTMTYSYTSAKEYRTMMGVSPGESIKPLLEAGADILGANCGNGTAGMIEIIKEMRTVDKDIPLLVHANAGLPIIEDGESVFPESPEEMSCQMNKLLEAGANIVGGCCGTTPEHIESIVNIIRNR
ncbi:MAG: homocysteine S-methyltransferase family protein [Bacteroidales bacterium]|nr:homocysteine S-methyltransferase family protein [Bacteroidales bacterium]